MSRLTGESIKKKLKQLKSWSRKGNAIKKQVEFKTFMKAIEFINRLAPVAEKHEHHPDMYISWKTVTLSLTTHDEGGLTIRDFKMAERIDKLLEN